MAAQNRERESGESGESRRVKLCAETSRKRKREIAGSREMFAIKIVTAVL